MNSQSALKLKTKLPTNSLWTKLKSWGTR